MGRLVALVTVVALGAGCTSYRSSKGVVSLGGGLIGGSLLIGGLVVDKNESVTVEDAASVVIPLVLLGLGLAVVGLVGMGVHRVAGDDGRRSPVVVAPPPQPPFDPAAQRMADEDRRRRAAWDLTQQARVAAHQHDCQRVAYLAARVIEIDRPTFDQVFSRDPYIVKCAPQPPPPPAPRPEPPRSIPIPPLNPPIPPPPPSDPAPVPEQPASP